MGEGLKRGSRDGVEEDVRGVEGAMVHSEENGNERVKKERVVHKFERDTRRNSI